ncbi:DNA repair protein RadC [Massilia sp. TS11]|uniref:RadC family protein n=1 Tax=Massilia sp. TS11 TaxID=2908003 RepID=UPI001EDC443E|nr:DNA repair protein RadC [Massilia sp. TS11]MCG2582760.1 DNA repair protein RadC [Massilia sp. TS11]
MSIQDWPAASRPRERLLAEGARALSDAELLAIFLRVGVRGRNAVEFARALLQQFGSLHALLHADHDAIAAVHGLGLAKYAELQAAHELARRAAAEVLRTGDMISSPEDAKHFLRLTLSHREYESFYVLFLDARHRLLAYKEMFRGTLTHTSVYPREVVKATLAHNAAALMLAHNHPSGSPEPSESDLLLTRALVQALALIDVRILDHFVVAGPQVHSFAEHGQI